MGIEFKLGQLFGKTYLKREILMIRFGRLLLVAMSFILLTACATGGSNNNWSNDWRNCMVAGLTVGAATGIAGDSEDGRNGAMAGAIIGGLWCALKNKDADGDGVQDDDDRCPGTFAGAEVDQNGCELDFDGDGVVDRLDQCPDTPSGARVDANGCELDSDGDGVVNSKDQCPNTPAGASVDSNGCELDDDGDGVVNSKDQCPDTAQGQAVNNEGCDLAEHYTLKGIYFEFDSAKLTTESMDAVQNALSILKRHPDLVVEIAGHTDSKGSDSYNIALSQRRANAVMHELLAHGVNAANLSARGYGESEPVADNGSDKGRAMNRRVELRQD
ncbi:MAG: OOP family OmpA-OmpF porin [Lysobacterales bacterium]